MSYARRLPVLRTRNALSLLEHHFLARSRPNGRPAWLRAPGTLMGPGALAMRNLLNGELKAFGTSSSSSVDALRNFELSGKQFGNLENSSMKRRTA